MGDSRHEYEVANKYKKRGVPIPIGSRFRNRVKILVRHRGNPGTEISGYDILPVMQPSCCGICAFEQEVVREKAESPSLNEFTRYMKRLYIPLPGAFR